MFLLMSNTSFSQTTSTNRTKCFSDAQVGEIFRGLKQNDYLKMRLDKTESALVTADKLINEQKSAISTQTEIIKVKDSIIKGEIARCDKEKEALNANISILNNNIEILKLDAKKDGKKKFWNGVKVGVVSISILGTAAILLLK